MEIYSREAREVINRVVRQVLAETYQPARSPAARTGVIYVAKTGGSQISARSGTSPGSATVTVQTIDSAGNLTAQTDESGADLTITAYNLSTTAVESNGYVIVQQDQLSGQFWCVWEDCP